LVVDDDAKLAGLVAEYLRGAGFAVGVEHDGLAAERRILAESPDVVVLDVMLPGADGFEVCRRVRDRFAGAVIMLTARGEEVDEVLGLELGADDYLAKPVRPRVLLTRVRALLRRREPGPAHAVAPVAAGGLRIDPRNRRATLDGTEVSLTTGEFDLLYFLASRSGQTVSRDTIYRALRGVEYDGIDRSIDLCVARLRKKLGDDARHPQRIKSVRGAGYLYAPDR
jgi:two-component system response regulator RstA